MFALSEQTGGLFLHDANDLSAALRKAAEDSDGYYLIGYHPDANTFDTGNGQAKFHRIEVRVKKSGLHVRSRDGFFGAPGSGNQSAEHSRAAQLNRALQSPYAGSIHPRVTAVFSNLRQTGSFISALVYFDPKELKWSSEPDGSHKAQVDIAGATFDENGLALATVDTTFPLVLNGPQYDNALKKGMVYGLHVPIGKPGPYLVRAALRDPATEGSGSAEQFVEVPDVESGHLALSGIVLQDAAASANIEAPHGPAPREDATGGAARRIFRRGSKMAYYYEILNAGIGAGHPELEVQTRLFRDGEQVLTDKISVNDAKGAPDPQRLNTGGSLSLAGNMAPGEYVLQVIVTDKLAKSKFNVVTQSVDFEIEP
jgi:hypothetical protein